MTSPSWVSYQEFRFNDLSDPSILGGAFALASRKSDGKSILMYQLGGTWPHAEIEVWEKARRRMKSITDARKINSRGEVLAGDTTFIRNGTIQPWSELIEGWRITNTVDLNNKGFILAKAKNSSGVEKPVLLVPVEVNEVSFSGDGYQELTSYETKGVLSAPQWVDKDGDETPSNRVAGEHNFTVAFKRNTKPTISAKFKLGAALIGSTFKVRAEGNDGIATPATIAQVSGDILTMPPTESNAAFPNTIKFYEGTKQTTAFSISWMISVDNGPWQKIASTKHTVCVLYADPLSPPFQDFSQGSTYSELYDLACEKACKYASEEKKRARCAW